MILAFQPDAGQATAFGIGAFIIFLFNKHIPYSTCFIVFIIINVSIVLAWCQLDPLPAVNQVELIMELAFKMGFLGFVGILFVILILLFPMLITLRHQFSTVNYENCILVLSFIVYFIAQLIVTVFGNYPVPIIGAGAAPVIGWYLILSLTLAENTNIKDVNLLN
ncbi:MAG: hypothetical protein Q8M03_14630 [Legionella sp.]|nr:hypothetical protein [Legionella sp.]